MAHDQAIRLHRVQRVHGVQQRFALLQARRFRLQVHRVRAQSRGRRAKADSCARGVFKESQRHGFAAQRCQLFQWMLLYFLKGLALIEKKGEFRRRKRFQRQQVTRAVGHISTRCSKSQLPNPYLFYTVHEHDALFVVDLAQTHLDNFGIAGLHHAAGELRLDRHFAMSTIDQHAQRHALRPPEVK